MNGPSISTSPETQKNSPSKTGRQYISCQRLRLHLPRIPPAHNTQLHHRLRQIRRQRSPPLQHHPHAVADRPLRQHPARRRRDQEPAHPQPGPQPPSPPPPRVQRYACSSRNADAVRPGTPSPTPPADEGEGEASRAAARPGAGPGATASGGASGRGAK
jgi:hypothetical protein